MMIFIVPLPKVPLLLASVRVRLPDKLMVPLPSELEFVCVTNRFVTVQVPAIV